MDTQAATPLDTSEPMTVSELLQLDPTAFVEDLHNATHEPDSAPEIDAEEEAQAAQRLADLRAQIVEEREATRVLRHQLAACDAALAAGRADESGLRGLAAAVQEKERLTEDAFVLSHSGAKLQTLLTDLQRLAAQRAQRHPTPGPEENMAALMQAAPVEDLQALHKALTA